MEKWIELSEMKHIVIYGSFLCTLIACTENNSPQDQEKQTATTEIISEGTEGNDEAKDDNPEKPKRISFEDGAIVDVSTKAVGKDPATGATQLDIYINHKLLKEPIKITRELNYSKVDSRANGIPTDAALAFSTWYAGGGDFYYGIVKNGVLQIYQKYEDEGSLSDGNYTLFREIDPNVITKMPAYYISYNSDDKKSKELMIAFTTEGKALFAKYYGQSRHLQLKFIKEEFEGKNSIAYYDEVVNGETTGTYKLTHSGNWDYAVFTRKKDGNKFEFTINHNVTIMNDTYRTVPSL